MNVKRKGGGGRGQYILFFDQQVGSLSFRENCKLENFRECFNFAKLRICEVS